MMTRTNLRDIFYCKLAGIVILDPAGLCEMSWLN